MNWSCFYVALIATETKSLVFVFFQTTCANRLLAFYALQWINRHHFAIWTGEHPKHHVLAGIQIFQLTLNVNQGATILHLWLKLTKLS